LNGCLCGHVVDEMATDAVKCKYIGCETQFYHHECVANGPIPCGWTCSACSGEGQSRGGKHT
ncbi:hypothetical protein BDQ17DRAFT_1262977, partial [Cyathus striatus]